MRLNFRNSIGMLGLLGLAVASCDKKTDWVAERDGDNFNSFVKIVHASPNFRAVHNNRDSFNVFIGANKANGTFMTYGSVMPGATTANYLAYPAGNQLFRLSVHGVTNPDSVNLYSFTKTLEANQRYSLIITDSIKNSNEKKQMWLKDDFTQPIPSQFGLRLAHAVVNDTAGKTIDLYSVKNKGNLFTGVPIGSATGFLYLPTTLSNDTLIVRRSGVTSWELARMNSVTYTNTRVYTFIYRGDTKLATTVTKGKQLVSYTNL